MFSWLSTDSLNNDCGKAMKTLLYLVNTQKLFLYCCYKDWNRINLNTLLHYVRLTPSPSRIRPQVSEVGMWNQHRSGGPLGQWPTRPSSLNPPLCMIRLVLLV